MAAPTSFKSVHLAQRPKSKIDSSTFTLRTNETSSLPALQPGQVLYQPHYLSLDPAMRGWLNDTRSYIPPVKLGAIMRGNGVGRILASKSPNFSAGQYVVADSGWTELAVLSDKLVQAINLPPNGKLTDALGVIGMTGLTAYFGILDVGQVKPGDFVVVSGAAGATGTVVGQIAKIKGARVLGLAGTDEKCAWLINELGFDAALNYKSPTFATDFRAATKSLIDVFFDNVGGEILDMALARAKPFARFVMCGGISQYNASGADVQGPKNYLMIVSMRIRMQGFIVFDYEKRYDEARRELTRWLGEGKIKRQETVVKGGIGRMSEALGMLYEGGNTGELSPSLFYSRLVSGRDTLRLFEWLGSLTLFFLVVRQITGRSPCSIRRPLKIVNQHHHRHHHHHTSISMISKRLNEKRHSRHPTKTTHLCPGGRSFNSTEYARPSASMYTHTPASAESSPAWPVDPDEIGERRSICSTPSNPGTSPHPPNQ
jgi:NADPH-dependent curcumin reductase CurA